MGSRREAWTQWELCGPTQVILLALCLVFWEKRACFLLRSHHALFTGARGVKKDFPGFPFEASMGVQMKQAPSLPHSQRLVQPEKLHAPFEWEHLMQGLHSSTVFGKPEDRSVCFKMQSSPINASCNLVGLWFRATLADVTNEPQMEVRSLFTSVIQGP